MTEYRRLTGLGIERCQRCQRCMASCCTHEDCVTAHARHRKTNQVNVDSQVININSSEPLSMCKIPL